MSMFGRVAAWFRGPPAQNDYVTTATVIDNLDPSAEGRVIVETRASQGDDHRQWARTATLMAGPDRGTWFIPDIGDEVVVIFEHGDRRRPIVVGSLWSGRAQPAEQIGAENERRAIVSRNGARIVMDDTNEGCVMRLETAQGQRLTLDDRTPGTITIADSSGSTIELSPAGVTVSTASAITVTAAEMTLSAATITVESGMVEMAVLKCPTLIADSVVAKSYTPGAGNIW